MARVTPPLSSIRPLHAGEYTELEILTQLADGLSDRFELFHSVDWSVSEGAADRHGEIDIVVVNDAGDVALLEVKAGELSVEGERLSKQYGGESKDVSHQIGRQFSSLMHRLKQEGLEVRLQHILVLPHQRVDGQGSVAYPRDRIADAADCADLGGFIRNRLGTGRPDAALKGRASAPSCTTAWRSSLTSRRWPAACSGA